MTVLTVDTISKTYLIGTQKSQSVLQSVLSIGSSKQASTELHVLSNISFTLEKGQVLGVVGKNGCGKSTLLRIIANVLTPDSGFIDKQGRLVPLIHLDSGVKTRLTMRENIFLAGTLLGMSWSEIAENFDAIIAYSGLEKFVNTKWYKFSDGMKQKVIFSIGIHSRPDIFLLDEAFSAGDEMFRRQSLSTISEMAGNGVSTIMVGHNVHSMQSCCDRVMWIKDGRVEEIGAPATVIEHYLKS